MTTIKNTDLTDAPEQDLDNTPIEYVTLYHPSGRIRKIPRTEYDKMTAVRSRPIMGRGMMGFGGMGGGLGVIDRLASGLQKLFYGIRQIIKLPPLHQNIDEE